MSEKVFLNDKLLPEERAKITIFDTGLQHGLGLFETLRCYNSRPFKLDSHIERLKKSADALGIAFDAETSFFDKAIAKLLSANALIDARVRITITAGSAKIGIHRGLQSSPTIIITAGPAEEIPKEVYSKGVSILLSDYKISPDDPIARHKTICFLPKLIGLHKARLAGLTEALWLTTDGFLACCSTANIFFVRSGKVYTPSLELPIVEGITRRTTIEICKEINLDVNEGRFTLSDLLEAEEVFITNSIVEILPVVAIEKHRVGNGSVGKITQMILELYKEKVLKETAV